MKTFREHLREQKYSEATIKVYTTEVQTFIKWCDRNNTTPTEIDYKRCLKFIKYLTRKGTKKKTINHRLRAVKIYFNYLVDGSCREDNPIEDTNIRGEKRGIHYDLLESEELEDLYYSFETTGKQEIYHTYTAKRNKIIVGFMVYQGLHAKDLKHLRLED